MSVIPEQQGSLPRQWARLHPLTPLLRFGRAVLVLIPVLTLNQRGRNKVQLYIDLAAVGVAVVAGVVSWLVTRWRIHGGELQIETGFIRRQSIRVPLTRLQAIDLVRPLFARMLGVAEVRIVVAGQGSGKTRLAYLTDAHAEQVRGQLLAIAHGLTPDVPTPAEQPLLHVPSGRIVGASLLSGFTLFIGGYLFAAIAVAVATPGNTGVAIGSAFPIVFALSSLLLRRIGAEWEFTVAEAGDGLRLRAGMLQTRAETIPYGRIQALRIIRPLWWRPLGWVRVEIDVARRRDRDRNERESGATTRALLPVGSVQEAHWIVARVFPTAPMTPPPLKAARAPRRAIWRAPLQWHNFDAWHDDDFVVCAEGWLARRTTLIPLAKAQSIRWSQGPVLRRMHLAHVHVDTAGRRFPGAARCRDEAQARDWINSLPGLARAARARH